MSWRYLRPYATAYLKETAKGAAGTLGSTVAACYLAINVEVVAHRTIFHFYPQWYANVEHANGLTQEMLDSVRIRARKEEEEVNDYVVSSREELALAEEDNLRGRSIFSCWNETPLNDLASSVQGEITLSAMTA